MDQRTEAIRAYRDRIYELGKLLNRETRVAIKYMSICCLTYEEMAKELGLSEGTVRNLAERDALSSEVLLCN